MNKIKIGKFLSSKGYGSRKEIKHAIKNRLISEDGILVKDFNALVFTSSNAVKNLSVDGEKKNIKCFCVGSVTEKIARLSGFTQTISASGNVNALKNLIINSKELKRNDKLAYICGDQITLELDKELVKEGFKVIPLNLLTQLHDYGNVR